MQVWGGGEQIRVEKKNKKRRSGRRRERGAAGHKGKEAEKIWKVRNNENWGKQRKIKGKEVDV